MTHSIALKYHANPEVLFLALRQLPDFIWLDSGRPHNSQGRYDILTAHARSKLVISANGEVVIDDTPTAAPADSPVTTHKTLEDWLHHHSQLSPTGNAELPFTGGVIGYFGYHWQDRAFGLESNASATTPCVQLASYDWAIIIDHHCQRATAIFSHAQHWAITQILPLLERMPAPLASFSSGDFTANTTKAQYIAAVEAVQAYIRSGDCYQVNLSQRFHAPYEGDLDSAYLTLRQATPSPLSAYIKHPQHSVLSLSPERFLQVTGRQVLTQPIKGSSPRGANTLEDQVLAQALVNSPKNRAENIMIVDLLRNDLSRCCKPFSVKVPHLCELHTFSNVHHLISTVTGELKDQCTAFELFKKSFPGGSITGAPKKRAMEIIAELENNPRGIYCGSVAYFSTNGNADSSITIRTLHAIENRLYCWGGGGVVIDSNAEDEYAESIFKVKKLMAALSGH